MSDSSRSMPPPAASAGSNGNALMGYQARLLERSGSIGSKPNFSLNDKNASGGATGLAPSGSVRRYASHRHNNSLSSGIGSGYSPNAQQGTFSSNGSLSSSSSTASTRSPGSSTMSAAGYSSYGTSNSSGSRSGGRPTSMPPAPREDVSAQYRRPISPTKDADRPPLSPLKGAAPWASPSSPSKGDASWISDSPKSAGVAGSMWSSSSASNFTPPAVHLSGVKDFKRSSVSGLSMLPKFTSRHADSGVDSDVGQTRVTFGKSKGQGDSVDDERRPERPGRIESEDGGELHLPGITTGAAGVAGLTDRIRLARQDITTPTSVGVSRSHKSISMDTQRQLLQAYEYLCRCGEAKAWIEYYVEGAAVGDVVDMEETMRNGLVLAQLVQHFRGRKMKIVYEAKHQWLYNNNLHIFFEWVKELQLPESFRFETVDLVNKTNFPKVVYCIHAVSHILARNDPSIRRVGNIRGQLQFTDAELEATRKGLDGKAMPAFGDLNKTLAKEMKYEPEPEPETDAERLARLVQENAAFVTTLQSGSRAFLGRINFSRLKREAAEAEARRIEEERRLAAERKRQEELERQRREEEERIRRELEAERQRKAAEAARLAKIEEEKRLAEEARRAEEARLAEVARLAEIARLAEEARIAEEARRAEEARLAHERAVATAAQTWIPQLQAIIRAGQLRRRFYAPILALNEHEDAMSIFQARARGAIARRSYEAKILALGEATEDIIKAQSACRCLLAKRTLLDKIRGLRSSTNGIVGVQAQVRGVLARQRHWAMSTALQRAEVTHSVGGLQSFARAALTRRKHEQQRKQLDFVTPDVLGLQAQVRGVIARTEYLWWRDHIRGSAPVAIHLQSLVRGLLARRAYFGKLRHFHEHMDKFVKIQAVFRGKQQCEQYRSLKVGTNVPVSTIKNFLDRLNDSDRDFEDEIEVEKLRKLVVSNIRENQTLENDVSDLDMKISRLVKNTIGIEDLIKAKNERGLLGRDREAALLRRNSVLTAANDPFSDSGTMDRNTKRKLELYQNLFHMLQVKPEYLARLFANAGRVGVVDRKSIEKIVLTLFGYAQNAREEFLLLKLFQRSVTEELQNAASPQDFIKGGPLFIKLVLQYNRGAKERKYLRDLLAPLVGVVMDEDRREDGQQLDLETDPCAIYRADIAEEEMRTGRRDRRPRDITFDIALNDPKIRTIFIRHLQALRGTTELFLKAIIDSTPRMPYGIRFIAREIYHGLKTKYTKVSDDALIRVVGHLVYYRYLNPAIVAPEGFDVIDRLVPPVQRKNLAEVSKMLTQITNGTLFDDANPYLIPLNEYVQEASARFVQWLHQVVDVPDADQYFNTSEFSDYTSQTRPVIYISPNEIYTMHRIVEERRDQIAPQTDDPLRGILHGLNELGSMPGHSNSQELNAARESEITLELIPALNEVEDKDNALFVETKRLVLAVLKVQSGKTLFDVIKAMPGQAEQLQWEEILSQEGLTADRQRRRVQRPAGHPSFVAGPSARLVDIRNSSFDEVKSNMIQNLLKLEERGRVSRATEYQEILDAIAVDIRNKHRKRLQRHNEKTAMVATLQNLDGKKKYFNEQITAYHSYIDASMQTMQKKGRKRFVLPLTQQYFHHRNLKAMGRQVPKFGSYKYTAAQLQDKGILVSIDAPEMAGRALDSIHLTISSDVSGLFTIEASMMGITAATCDLRIEDLLEAQFNGQINGQQTMTLMDGMAKVDLNLLIHLINSKFYA